MEEFIPEFAPREAQGWRARCTRFLIDHPEVAAAPITAVATLGLLLLRGFNG